MAAATFGANASIVAIAPMPAPDSTQPGWQGSGFWSQGSFGGDD